MTLKRLAVWKRYPVIEAIFTIEVIIGYVDNPSLDHDGPTVRRLRHRDQRCVYFIVGQNIDRDALSREGSGCIIGNLDLRQVSTWCLCCDRSGLSG